jgi:ABC-type glycerol-3-phosphate transport system substrate-binding protein
MKFRNLLALSLALVMVLAACGNGGGGADDGATAAVDAPAIAAVDGAAADADLAVAAADRDHYRFQMWYAYSWYSPDPWGDCMISAHWGEMFNIHMYQDTPDANEMEVLMLMVTAGDLPDAIWMDRNVQNMQIARLGMFVPVDDMKAMVDNTWYDDNILASTQRFFEIDGVNYIVPNWARQGPIGVQGYAPGGNLAWMITTNVWEAVGSPPLTTFEELFEYAMMVRDAELTNHVGASIIPMLTNDGHSFGTYFINAIYRSMGGVVEQWWFSLLEDGTFGMLLRSDLYRDAVLEANRWHRYGLFPTTNITNTRDEFMANFNTGRGGLVWFDHSTEDAYRWRRILMEDDPGNSIELIVIPDGGRNYIHPPARGLPLSRIYHQHQGTLGWNGTFVTTSAERPYRIFELMTWLLTPMGSIEMMYGPRGHLWEELDANGYPIMLRPPESIAAAERAEIGMWQWTLAGHSNHVDNTKFAVNNAMPIQYQSWVETIQYTLFTPYRVLSDEFALIPLAVEPGTDLAIRRQQMEDHFREMMPQVIMADSADEANRMMDEILAFAEAIGLAEVEAAYNARFEYNVAVQGGSVFRLPGTP